MLRPLGMLAGWVAATAAVVGLGWAAVGTVASAVTDPPPLAQPPPVQPVAGEGPTTDPPAAATAATHAFDLAGGTVGVQAGAGSAELLFATPRTGFSVEVRSRGPSQVDVRFSSDDHESRFRYDPADGPRLEERAE